MKRILICAIMIATIFTGMSLPVYGASLDSADLLLTTKVTGVTEIKIFNTPVTTVNGFNGTELTKIDLDVDGLGPHIAYATIKTNKLNKFTVDLSAVSLTGKTASNNYKIRYIVSPGSGASFNNLTSDDGATKVEIYSHDNTGGVLGMQIIPIEFRIQVYTESAGYYQHNFENATEDTYNGTIKIELISG